MCDKHPTSFTKTIFKNIHIPKISSTYQLKAPRYDERNTYFLGSHTVTASEFIMEASLLTNAQTTFYSGEEQVGESAHKLETLPLLNK